MEVSSARDLGDVFALNLFQAHSSISYMLRVKGFEFLSFERCEMQSGIILIFLS